MNVDKLANREERKKNLGQLISKKMCIISKEIFISKKMWYHRKNEDLYEKWKNVIHNSEEFDSSVTQWEWITAYSQRKFSTMFTRTIMVVSGSKMLKKTCMKWGSH